MNKKLFILTNLFLWPFWFMIHVFLILRNKTLLFYVYRVGLFGWRHFTCIKIKEGKKVLQKNPVVYLTSYITAIKDLKLEAISNTIISQKYIYTLRCISLLVLSQKYFSRKLHKLFYNPSFKSKISNFNLYL